VLHAGLAGGADGECGFRRGLGRQWVAFCPYPMALSSRDAPPFLTGLAPARGLLGRLRDRLVRPLVLGVVKKAFLPPLNRVRAEVGAARLQRFVPHGPLLERAVCAMTHGGMGATQKALVHGVPVCVVPFGRDRLEVARRVEVAAPELACQRHGCGRTSCATGSTRRRRRPALPDESPRRSRPGARVVSGESRELISGSSRGRRPLRRSQRRVRMLYRWVHQSEQVSNRPLIGGGANRRARNVHLTGRDAPPKAINDVRSGMGRQGFATFPRAIHDGRPAIASRTLAMGRGKPG
jgi:hypothetical protein